MGMTAKGIVIALAIMPAILLMIAVLFDWMNKRWDR